MTVSIANTNITNSFGFLVNRVNELATAASNKMVSTNSNTATGNAAITGTFFANNIVVGNSTSNSVISFSSFPGTANNSAYFAGQLPSYYANTQLLSGSLSLSGQHLQNTSPTGNPTGGALNATYSTLLVQANTTNSSNNRQFAVSIGLYSNTGRSATGNNKDNVGLYVGVVAEANSGDLWALNTVTTINASANLQTIGYGYELDVNNLNSDRYTFDYPIYGLGITGAGIYKATTALLVAGTTATNGALFYRGMSFVSNSVSMNTIEDQTNSNTSYLINGSHKYGIDMGSAAIANAAIRLPVGGQITLNTNINMLYGDSSNNVVLGKFGSVIVDGIAGSLLVNSTAPGGWATTSAVESVSTNSYAYSLSAYHNNTLTNGAAILARVDNQAGSYADVVRFFANTSLVGTISTNGSSVAYNTTSDYRIKENLHPIQNAGNKIDQLNMFQFNYKNSVEMHLGGIAHDIQKIVPSAVTGQKDDTYENGAIKLQMVDYSKLVPILIAALQETREDLRVLKASLNSNGS